MALHGIGMAGTSPAMTGVGVTAVMPIVSLALILRRSHSDRLEGESCAC
jgi:hypothetical protein